MSSHCSGSSAHSVHSFSNRPDSSLQESLAKVYFAELQKYLAFVLSQELTEGVPIVRVTARQKLSRLNNLQFHELATDVYDELLRRTNDRHGSFLPNRDDFHPRRNQARQKLASLASDRFRDLSSDIHFEIRRRYPFVEQVKSIEKSSPEIDQGPKTIENLDSLMNDLKNMVRPSPGEPKITQEDLRKAYESKVTLMAQEIKSLQLSFEKAGELNKKNKGESELEERYNQLVKEHQEQQTAVREVKYEIRTLIEELKQLSDKNESLMNEKERAERKVRKLTEENRQWQTQYASLRMVLRAHKTDDALWGVLLKPTSTGAIRHPSMVEYEKAMDELMQTSRSVEPTEVLNSIRTLVLCCKSITAQVEAYEMRQRLSEADQSRLYELKKKFSTELSGLLSATTGFAHGMGLSPVSLVDAAAVTLTATVIDLVKLVGMRSGVEAESEAMDKVLFLKREAEHMTQSVDNLLAALHRGEKTAPDLITSTVQIVSNILSVSRQSLAIGEEGSEGRLILLDLENHSRQMLTLRDGLFYSSEPVHPMTQQGLAEICCKVTEQTQRLISWIDREEEKSCVNVE